MDTEMRNIVRFLLIIIAFVPVLLSQSPEEVLDGGKT